MNASHYQEMIQSASFAYVHQRIILDDSGEPCDFMVLDANPAFAKFIGLPLTDIRNRTVLEIRPDLRNSPFDWFDFWDKVALNGGTDEKELYLPHAKRWYRVQGHSHKKSELHTFIFDITDKKDLSKDFEYFFDISLDLLCIANKNGYFIRVNKEWENILGYKTRDLENRKFLDLVHPDDLPATLEALATLGSNKDVNNFVNRYRHKDGSYRYIEWQSQPQGDLYYAAARDITERKKAEAALREEHSLMQYIIRHDPNAIAIHDRELRYIYVSDRYLQDYGVAREDIIGKHHYDVMPDIPEKWRKIHKRALSGEVISKTNDIFIRQDGSIEHTNWACRPWFRTDNTIGGIVLYTEVITKRKQAEKLLKKNLREKEILLSEIHHRVKNNMAVISSLLALQIEFLDTKKEPEILLYETQNRIKSISLVHELVYANNNFVEINFAELLNRLVKLVDEIHNTDEKNVTVDIRAVDVTLEMNSSIPLSLLANELITNAYKHAFNGRKNGRIEIRVEREMEVYLLTVKDNGIGVSDTTRLDSPETFGFTIVHGLAQQLRGKLTYTSAENEGLRVDFRFSREIGRKQKNVPVIA